jgi:hypothetical protein
MTKNMAYSGPSGAPGIADHRRGHPTTPEYRKATPGKSYAAGAHRLPTDYHGRPVLKLNSHWSVGDDGALQWFLLRRAGNDWHPRRFHVERDALLRSVRELSGTVDPASIETVRGWPPLYRPETFAMLGMRPGPNSTRAGATHG